MPVGPVVVLALLVAVVLAVKAIRLVPPSHLAVVRRARSSPRVLGPGLTTIVPFLDKVSHTLDAREQVRSHSHVPLVCADHLLVLVDWTYFHQVTDPVEAVDRPPVPLVDALDLAGLRALRESGGRIGSADLRSRSHAVEDSMRQRLDADARGWGARVDRVEITDVHLPPHPDNYLELSRVSQSGPSHPTKES